MPIKVDARTNGRSLAERLRDKLPESKRAQLMEILGSDDAAAAIEELGNMGLRQEDHSRGMQEVAGLRKQNEEWHGRLGTWEQQKQAEFAKTQRELEEARRRMGGAHLGGGGDDDGEGAGGDGAAGRRSPAVDTSNLVSKDDLRAEIATVMAQSTQYATRFAAFMPKLVLDHAREFEGEVLDTGALLAHCSSIGMHIDKGGYDSFVAEKRREKQTQDFDKRLKEAEERGRAQGRAENAQLPYVSMGAESAEGTLSGLNRGKSGDGAGVGDGKTGNGSGNGLVPGSDPVSRAVATFHAERAKRGGAGF